VRTQLVFLRPTWHAGGRPLLAFIASFRESHNCNVVVGWFARYNQGAGIGFVRHVGLI